MTYPYLTIDLDKIEHNARAIVGLCSEHGIEVAGVTKLTCGHPEIARSMLRGGVTMIADSRLENILRLQQAGIAAPMMLLRLPPLSGVEQVVTSVGTSLNSEPAVLEGLSHAALKHGGVHEVMLMVDLGDLREGVWPDELNSLAEHALRLRGIEVVGLGTNLACFAGVVPTVETMQRLVALADGLEHQFDTKLKWISGINSSGLELIASGKMPSEINHARIGEAILLGRETVHRNPWPDAYQDAFILHAEVLELKTKPSMPAGERSQDAFGQRPMFEDRGRMLRALVNIGREDVEERGIKPIDPGLRVLGASSGYLALDASASEGNIKLGAELTFSLNYGALLRAMTSEYVKKRLRHDTLSTRSG